MCQECLHLMLVIIRGSSILWLCSDTDLDMMYDKNQSGEITLWCNGNRSSDKESAVKSKRKRDDLSTGTSKRQKKEEGDDIFQDLKHKHGTNYNTPRLHLWAQMVANKLHDDLDTPPTIPAFTSTPHRPRSQLLSTVISGAATAYCPGTGRKFTT